MTDRISPDGEVYYPTPEVVAQARVKDWDALASTRARRPAGLLGQGGRGAGVVPQVGQGPRRLEEALLQVVRRARSATSSTTRSTGTRRPGARTSSSLVWVGERNEVRTYSYFALNRDVCKFANVLKAMGVKKGDRVTIYMPRIPEIVIAMLACAKIGAIHSVVYGGFSVDALQGRIEDSRVEGGRHRRRRLHERQGRRAEEDRRRRRPPLPHGGDRHRGAAHRPRGPHGGGPRLLVPRPHEAAARHRRVAPPR